MAVVNLVPGTTSVEAMAAFSPVIVRSPLIDAPGGLYPLMSSAWDMDDYRILNGWPIEVPSHDIFSSTTVNAEGTIITGREDPTGIETGAFVRWVAEANYYDEDAMVWRPTQGPSSLVWETSTDYAPVLIDDYEYRLADEKFFMTAMNFDSDERSHMWCDFTSVLQGISGYTVILVMSPNSAFGNNVEVPFNGIWAPGRATPVGDTFAEAIGANWMSVTLQGNYLYLQSETTPRTRSVALGTQLNATTPSYLVFSFSRPQTTLYVASGPANIVSKTIGTPGQGLDNGIVLGRSTGDVLHTADMALFDVGLYANVLTAAQIRDEIAILSRAYGGDK